MKEDYKILPDSVRNSSENLNILKKAKNNQRNLPLLRASSHCL